MAKLGMSIEQLLTTVQKQQKLKRDYVVSAHTMAVRVDYPGADKKPEPHLFVNENTKLAINETAHSQLADFLKIPLPYYKRMRDEEPELMASNINTWLDRNSDKTRMIRTLGDTARAVVSAGYKRRDNLDLLETMLPPLMERGVILLSSDISADHMWLKVVDQKINLDMPHGRQLGDGSHEFIDTFSPALWMRNSEVGRGSLEVHGSIYTHLCTNLAVVSESSVRKYHIGGRHDIGEDAYQLLTEETKSLTDRAWWGQVRDVALGVFDQLKFEAAVKRLKKAADDKIEVPVATFMEMAQEKLSLSGDEAGSILDHLVRSGDLSRFGLHAAITRASQDVMDYGRASELEVLGGEVIDLSATEWKELAAA